MSFNDLPPTFDCFEQLPDGALNPTEALIIVAIAYHPEGCWIGIEALAKRCRTTKGNLLKRIRGLKKLGIVETEQTYARKGLRQRYTLNVSALKDYAQRVSVETPLVVKEVRKDGKGVGKDLKGISEVAKGLPTGHPYKEYKQYKNDKDERYSFIVSGLSEEIKELID
jgi:DNA-binding MarR family transcriptional regulator